MAVALAQPTDVVKVRFQAQVRLVDGERRYNGTLDAYRTIARDEGIRGLWKGGVMTYKDEYIPFPYLTSSCCLSGCMPNITRNAIVNCAELVTYDLIKEVILNYDIMTGEQQRNPDDRPEQR